MVKFGTFEQNAVFFAPGSGLVERVRRKLFRRQVSLRLLRLPLHPSEAEVALFEEIVTHLRLPSGVFRTTYRNRFRDLDIAVNGLLRDVFPSHCALRVADWAASSCLTSYEWETTLRPIFHNLVFDASDLILFLVELENSASREHMIFDPDGVPLQYIRYPFVIPMDRPESWLFPINRLLHSYSKRRFRNLTHLISAPASWLENPDQEDALQQDQFILRKLSLIHPWAVKLMRSNPRFIVSRRSVFDPVADPLDVIRSMNIFNPGYFSQHLLEQGAQNVIAGLRNGGIWIVGRTIAHDPPVHDATIFRKTQSNALEVIARIGHGSEIEEIIISTAANLMKQLALPNCSNDAASQKSF